MEPQVTVKASALQRVLHQPSSQQMTGTPRTQWNEIDTVVNILNKLSLLNSGHRTNFRGGGVNIVSLKSPRDVNVSRSPYWSTW